MHFSSTSVMQQRQECFSCFCIVNAGRHTVCRNPAVETGSESGLIRRGICWRNTAHSGACAVKTLYPIFIGLDVIHSQIPGDHF